MEVELKNYGRSTHDLSYIWRSTMAAGTLVPFMKIPTLPGDTFDINLEASVLTKPTIGPLFGSYKLQLDVFTADVRLYQGRLHNNALNIGLAMQNVKLPKITFIANDIDRAKNPDNQQVNPSSIFSYLGIKGIGQSSNGGGSARTRNFNAIPYLAYWDIFKNYYANKQETNALMIHNTDVVQTITDITIETPPTAPAYLATSGAPAMYDIGYNTVLVVTFAGTQPNLNEVQLEYEIDVLGVPVVRKSTLAEMFNFNLVVGSTITLTTPKTDFYGAKVMYYSYVPINSRPASIVSFPLANIDTMREDILTATKVSTAFIINSSTYAPYGLPLKTEGTIRSATTSQEGLALKTYQSDIFNNWIKTEWISGTNSINDLTKIDTTGGNFTIDTLTLKRKIYNMMNAIAVSGGSYDDFIEANYSNQVYGKPESPVYQGGLSKEIVFQEVVSNSATDADGGQPLGTLAGRGVLGKKHKGGYVRIKTTEYGYVMGIVSITPRVDYSQGNDWDVTLDNMDDWHKPALDGIGFQDLLTDQMASWSTNTGTTAGTPPSYKSAGKQPAWLNYMTNYNKAFGNFAIESQEMFMTLNRRYEPNGGNIKDLTTYVDPSKFNHIFAQTSRDAQNFWVQLGINIEARRKMSAKIMPQG